MKTEEKRLTLSVAVRVPVKTHRRLAKKCFGYGGVSVVMRELIDAYLEDRITIQPRTKGII